ncbi:MAG TPA: family 10 glycosylhydrolase [Bacilli bacterium]|nr:MAG: hypothetical protein BWY97_01205 [Tenericutes bacterium ADurb.BinA124]HNZ50228.1 family 10 glycosylhydrolase [Bacilli bacterium]HPX83679.1 family 10 glycosylhydrolase [Bacilli bacterium]HQC74507.1 family 10 glycosylhydrolase [Bacilli bacterium]
MRKILAVLLLIMMVAGVRVYASSTIIVDDYLNGKDITRYDNYLVYYSFNASLKSPANQWGYEIAVNKDHFVIDCNTKATMEGGGYIISGHGTKKDQLMNVKVGDQVTIDWKTKKIIIARDPLLSSQFLAHRFLQTATVEYEHAIAVGYRFDEVFVNQLLELNREDQLVIDEIVGKENPTASEINQVSQLAKDIEARALSIKYLTSYSQTTEIRALWHRPNAASLKEDNLANLQAFVQEVKSLGFNTLFVETLWNGYVSYRSELMSTHPQVASFTYGEEYQNDYIAALIGECRKVGIDVHAWCHTFNGGDASYKAASIKDEWLLEDYQGLTLHPNVYGGSYFLDPSNPEVLTFLTNVFSEMIEKYDFAGLQLDYIRYDDNNYAQSPIRDSGYGLLPETRFKEAYGLTGDVRTLIKQSANLAKWNQWRQNNITNAVKVFSQTLRRLKPDIIISADVVADINNAKATCMQDWQTWVKRGYLDLLCPMIYTGSADVVEKDSLAIMKQMKNLSFLASGIAPTYYGYSLEINHDQFIATRAADGVAFFASQNVVGLADVSASIKTGVFRYPALSPLVKTSLVINHGLIGLKQYVQTAMINEAKQTMFLNYVDEMIEMDCENPADYQKLMEKMLDVQTMASAINSNFQRDFFVQELGHLIHILDVKISREMMAFGYYDPSDGERLDPSLFSYPKVKTEPEPEPEPETERGCLKIFTAPVWLFWGALMLLFRKKERGSI